MTEQRLHCVCEIIPWNSDICRTVNNLVSFKPLIQLLHFALGIAKRNVYWSHPSVCVSVCVWLSLAACLHYCMYPDVTLGNGRWCPIVVHCWTDLQSVHGFHCYGNICTKCEMSVFLYGWFLNGIKDLFTFVNRMKFVSAKSHSTSNVYLALQSLGRDISWLRQWHFEHMSRAIF